MPAGRGEHERLDGVWLAAHVAEVDARSPPALVRGAAATVGTPAARDRRRQWVAGSPPKHARGAGEALGDLHLQPLHQRCLACACAREHQPAQALLVRGLRDRERAVAGAHLAVEGELPEERVARQALARELAGGGEDGASEREVEAGTDLGEVAGGEVRGDALLGELVAELRIAARTRSRASRTAASARPTIVNAGSPARMSTSTATGCV